MSYKLSANEIKKRLSYIIESVKGKHLEPNSLPFVVGKDFFEKIRKWFPKESEEWVKDGYISVVSESELKEIEWKNDVTARALRIIAANQFGNL
jgi:nicotinic acid mononucleotide adenylyltransferase